MVAQEHRVQTLADLVDRILDKGLVLNADITVSIVGVELLGIKLRAALASFETAARYGLQFPSGTCLHAPGWKEAACGGEGSERPSGLARPLAGNLPQADWDPCLWRLTRRT